MIMKLETKRGERNSLINPYQPVPCGKHIGSQKEKGRLFHPWIIVCPLARARFQCRLMNRHRNPKI